MALEDLEVNVGGTSIKGVWIAIVLTFGSTIGGGIWAASQFFAQLNEQSEAVVAATTQAEGLATRFDDLRESNATRLQAMDFRNTCLLYTSPSPRDGLLSRMPSSA